MKRQSNLLLYNKFLFLVLFSFVTPRQKFFIEESCLHLDSYVNIQLHDYDNYVLNKLKSFLIQCYSNQIISARSQSTFETFCFLTGNDSKI